MGIKTSGVGLNSLEGIGYTTQLPKGKTKGKGNSGLQFNYGQKGYGQSQFQQSGGSVDYLQRLLAYIQRLRQSRRCRRRCQQQQGGNIFGQGGYLIPDKGKGQYTVY